MLPEKAIWWPAQQALLVSDVHLGKAASFRERGMAVPMGSSASDLQRLTVLIQRWQANALWIVGDLVHAKPTASLIRKINDWRQQHADLEFHLVAGNHDRHMRDVPTSWRLDVHRDLTVAGIELRHEPLEVAETVCITGHLHPTVRFGTGYKNILRAPAFWVQPKQLVMPAFGEFTGGWNIQAHPEDRVFAVGPDAVLEVPVMHRG